MKRVRSGSCCFGSVAIVFVLATAAGYAQPPEPGRPGNAAPGGWFHGNANVRMVVKNGKVTIEILDDKGNVIQKREFDRGAMGGGLAGMFGNVLRPPRPPFPGLGEGAQGTLAVSKKYVFVLLNGTLYQYDIDTLKLKNKVQVAPEGGFRLQVLPRLRNKENGPRLGIGVAAVDDQTAKQHGLDKPTGVLVRTVAADSPAAKAGIQPGDLILEYDGKQIASPEALMDAVRAGRGKNEATVMLLRGKERQTVTVKFGAAGAALTPRKRLAPPRPPGKREARAARPDRAQGRRVNFDVTDANLQNVLHMLSAQTGARITCAQGVHGAVTATLKDMPLEAALDSILDPLHLTWRKTKANTYIVEPADKG